MRRQGITLEATFERLSTARLVRFHWDALADALRRSELAAVRRLSHRRQGYRHLCPARRTPTCGPCSRFCAKRPGTGRPTGSRSGSSSRTARPTSHRLPVRLKRMQAKRPVSILAVIHTPALEVLLLERVKPSQFWQSITGSQEDDESLAQTAVREIREETGFSHRLAVPRRPPPEQPLPSHTSRVAGTLRRRVSHNTEHVFSACIESTAEPFSTLPNTRPGGGFHGRTPHAACGHGPTAMRSGLSVEWRNPQPEFAAAHPATRSARVARISKRPPKAASNDAMPLENAAPDPRLNISKQ